MREVTQISPLSARGCARNDHLSNYSLGVPVDVEAMRLRNFPRLTEELFELLSLDTST